MPKDHVDFTSGYKAGDPKPEGYMEQAEWARVQITAGLRQKKCPSCELYFFPHEQHKCNANIAGTSTEEGE